MVAPLAIASEGEGLAIVLVLGAVMVIAVVRSDRRKSREARVDPDLPEHVYRLRIGSADTPIPAALSQAAWPRLAEFLNVGDEFGVAELAEQGHVALLPAETMVRRIKVQGLLAELRIEDREHRGVLAWTLASYLTKDRR